MYSDLEERERREPCQDWQVRVAWERVLVEWETRYTFSPANLVHTGREVILHLDWIGTRT